MLIVRMDFWLEILKTLIPFQAVSQKSLEQSPIGDLKELHKKVDQVTLILPKYITYTYILMVLLLVKTQNKHRFWKL